MALAAPPAARPSRAPRKPKVLQPFTLPHFRAWAADLILDNGQSWHPEAFQEAPLEDIFAGVPEVWFVVPEGNGKTTLVAGLAIYHTEFRPYASVAVAASSREQAEILYRQAEGFVLRSERLHHPVHSAIQQAKGKRKLDVPRFTCLEGYRRINHHAGGRIQVFAADDRTGDGIIPTLAIPDELHRHRDLSLYRTWSGKLAKRDGQIAAISTAGEPGSDFETTRERIRQTGEATRQGSYVRVAAGRIVLHEWAVPEKADVADMAVVKAANPFSGITIEGLAEKYASPTMTLEHWRRFVCNLPTRGSNAAITEVEWAAAKTADIIPKGEPVAVGLDVAWKWDTTSAVPLWFKDPTYRLFAAAEVLVPPRDGSMLDGRLIENALIRIHTRNPIHTIVMDLSRAEQLAQWASQEFDCKVVDWQQSIPVGVEEYDRFMEALRKGWIRHAGDQGLTSHALNAIARVMPRGDAIFERPAQNRRSAEQDNRVIDALKAASMVHCYMATRKPPRSPLAIGRA